MRDYQAGHEIYPFLYESKFRERCQSVLSLLTHYLRRWGSVVFSLQGAEKCCFVVEASGFRLD